MMNYASAKPAASAASIALLALCLAVAAFMPPLQQRVLPSVPLTVAVGLAIAVALALHLFFVGLAAARLGRSPLAWALLALVTLPLGSIIGLILIEWYAHQQEQQPGNPSAPGAA
jgi:hypothetical protein